MSLESFQIHLSSSLADKLYDGLTSDVEWYLPTIEIPSNYHVHVGIENLSIPYSFYNTNSNNNLLYYNEGGTAKTLIITPGNYNANNIIDELKKTLVAFTITYNPITNRLTFNNLLSFYFYSSSTCLALLGISTNNLNPIGNTLVSDMSINLSPYRSIQIASNLKTFSINTFNKNNTTVLATIPINTAPNSVIVYQNQSNFNSNTFSNIISNIRIRLIDHLFRPIDLNGLNFGITLRFTIVDYVN